MPKKTTNDEARQSSQSFPYANLDAYLAAVRKLLLGQQLRAGWVDELLSADGRYLAACFEKQEHPAAAAFEIFITEDEATREPVPADHQLRVDVSEQAKKHLTRLVDLGLWGGSIEEVAKTLVEQALAAKLESGLLRIPNQNWTHK